MLFDFIERIKIFKIFKFKIIMKISKAINEVNKRDIVHHCSPN